MGNPTLLNAVLTTCGDPFGTLLLSARIPALRTITRTAELKIAVGQRCCNASYQIKLALSVPISFAVR